MKLRVIRYRKYKTFSNNAFVNSLRRGLTRQKKALDERATHSQKFVHKFFINSPFKKIVFKFKP